VVPLQPDLGQVGKAAVVRNLIGREVVVEIEDRLVPRIVMVEGDRFLAGQEKIIVDEAH